MFSAATAVREVGRGEFDVEIGQEWTVVGKPNGGYMLAIMARAATAVSQHGHPLAVSAHFLNSPDPGPARICVEELRTGRTTSTLRASLLAEGGRCVEALITCGELSAAGQPFWDGGVPQYPWVDFDDAVRMIPPAEAGFRVQMMETVELRLDPDSMQWPSGRGRLSGWLALPEGEDFDAVSLLFALDALPPATFDVEFTGWVPTLELSCYLRALPAPGPVRVVQSAQLVAGHRVDQTCFVWDCQGRLVAQATQLASVRLG